MSIDKLAGLPFIGLSGRGPLGQLLTSHLEKSGVDLNMIVFTETYQIAKALVVNGSGVSIVDAITARSAERDNVRRWLLDPPLRYSIDVLHSDSMPPSILCRRFVKHLKSVIGQHLRH